MVKADGTSLKTDETADFKIIEFSKDNKKIIASHARIHEEVAHEKKKEATNEKHKEAKSTDDAVKKLKGSIEKSTLGDIQALSSLKSDLETAENAATAKKVAKIKAEADKVAEKVAAAEVAPEATEEAAEKKAPKAKKTTTKKTEE